MLQGGEVQHLAARAKGVKERISTITSYRSKVARVYDSSYITNIRPYANLNSLYPEWTQYRLRKLRDEITLYLEKAEARPSIAINREELDTLINQQIEYLQRTSRQMVPVEFEHQILEKYGKVAYYDAPRIWQIVQSLPNFERLASSMDQERRWMPESAYWMDLHRSIEFIRLNRPLQSALGPFAWNKSRRYYMGDELLRQGLNEVFLDWMGSSGLWDLYCKHRKMVGEI